MWCCLKSPASPVFIQPGVDQGKHQSSASLAFVRWFHRGPVNSPHKWPATRNCSGSNIWGRTNQYRFTRQKHEKHKWIYYDTKSTNLEGFLLLYVRYSLQYRIVIVRLMKRKFRNMTRTRRNKRTEIMVRITLFRKRDIITRIGTNINPWNPGLVYVWDLVTLVYQRPRYWPQIYHVL